MFGFRTRLLLAFTLLATGFTTLATIYFYQLARRQVYEQMALRLKDLGRLGQYSLSETDRQAIVSLDRLARDNQSPISAAYLAEIPDGEVAQPLSGADAAALEARPDYQRLIQVVRAIKRATREQVTLPQNLSQRVLDPGDVPQIRFVYILTTIPESPDRKYLRFIADGDYERLDMNDNGMIDEDEEPTQIGMIYNVESQAELREAFDGQVLANKEFATDAWGTWFSSYTPIIDPADQRVIAVLGIDLDVYGPHNALQTTLYVAVGICVASFLLSIVVAWAAANYFGRPIRALTDAAHRVRQRDFEARAPVYSKDELGQLTETFNTMVADIGAYSHQMEDMVAQRTKELREALAQVQALKQKQDADYFLTTLLTNPLLKNNNTSGAVCTQFLIEQKKRFRFKQSEAHLGGDVCISGEVVLRGQRWIMFLNGDAMGKSMQGAGGALVLGTVVNSMLKRAQETSGGLPIGPEEWLRNACNELQKVFITFEGSMLVSCIMGLINEADGMMIYFNAEHPAAILYRHGVASFIEEEATMRKLGFPFISGFDLVRVQLQLGDIVFVGSDGKDDIRLLDENGEKAMNEDEARFLRVVEGAQGHLDLIRSRLEETGELTDDLSIVRIEYSGARAPFSALPEKDSSTRRRSGESGVARSDREDSAGRLRGRAGDP